MPSSFRKTVADRFDFSGILKDKADDASEHPVAERATSINRRTPGPFFSQLKPKVRGLHYSRAKYRTLRSHTISCADHRATPSTANKRNLDDLSRFRTASL
jgi:hypothetical protein